MLNNGTSKLDHLITTSKSFGDHSGVGCKGESSSTKTVFVKSSLLADYVNVSFNNPAVRFVVKNVATKASLLYSSLLQQVSL